MVRRAYVIALALIMALIGFVISPAGAQTGRTFYIDYDNGSNSNPGTKASPWKTHPFMQTNSGCTGNGSAPTYTHSAGDQFIFKGGVSWPAACFEMTIAVGGTSGSVDYYGVDQTWYTGASFADPVFDLNYAIPTGNHVINATSSFSGYATFDGLEILHQGIDPAATNAGLETNSAYDFLSVSGSMPGVTIQNGEILDWAAPSTTDIGTIPSNCSQCYFYSAGSIEDGHDRITVNHMTITDANGYVYKSGVKYNGGTGGGCVNCGTVENSTFGNGFAGCFSVQSCHDNEFYGISQTLADLCACRPHTQVVEDDWGAIIGMQVYNNYIHDNPNAGVTVYVNYTSYVYNNVMKNNSNGNINFGEPGGNHAYPTGLTGYVVNNTVDCSNGTSCFATDSKGALSGTVVRNNNISITNAGSDASIVSSIAAFVNGPNNYKMSTSEASTYGFTGATKYAPTSSDNHVTSAGANLSGACSVQLADLCEDAQGAAWYGGSYQTRPLDSTAWTIGAYVFGGQSQQSSKPNPPTDLTASVQ